MAEEAEDAIGECGAMKWVRDHRWSALGAGLFLVGCVVALSLSLDTPAKRAQQGREAADRDWNERRARYYSRTGAIFQTEHRGYRIGSYYHPRSGLFPAVDGADGHGPEYCDAYNARIDELLAENGPPPWAPSKALIAPDEVVAALSQADLKLVDGYPYNVNLEIGYSRNPFQGRKDFFVGRLQGRPDLVVIRGDKSTVCILTEKGQHLYFAERIEGQSPQ